MRLAALAAAAAFAVVLAAPAVAQEVIVAAPAEPSFWGMLQEPIVTVIGMVLVAIGGQIVYWINRLFGTRAAKAASELYEDSIDNVVGWIVQHLPPGAKPDQEMLESALDYFRESWPKASAIEPSDGNVISDILARMGRATLRS